MGLEGLVIYIPSVGQLVVCLFSAENIPILFPAAGGINSARGPESHAIVGWTLSLFLKFLIISISWICLALILIFKLLH